MTAWPCASASETTPARRFHSLGARPGPPCCLWRRPARRSVFAGSDGGRPLLSRGRLVLHHQLSWHPTAVFDLDALRLCPLANLCRVQSAGHCPGVRLGLAIPGNSPVPGELHRGNAPAPSGTPPHCMRSGQSHIPCRRARSARVLSASPPSRSSISRVCTFCAMPSTAPLLERLLS
jgi:hypothetical protein